MAESYKYLKSPNPLGTEENDAIFWVSADGKTTRVIPMTDDNPRYREIMRQVEAGELTIAPADEEE